MTKMHALLPSGDDFTYDVDNGEDDDRCAFCLADWPCDFDDHLARILAAEELDPGAEWNLAGTDRA